jgi:hypothetical protein
MLAVARNTCRQDVLQLLLMPSLHAACFLRLQVVGEVKPPQCDEDVKRLYRFIEAEEAWLAAHDN